MRLKRSVCACMCVKTSGFQKPLCILLILGKCILPSSLNITMQPENCSKFRCLTVMLRSRGCWAIVAVWSYLFSSSYILEPCPKEWHSTQKLVFMSSEDTLPQENSPGAGYTAFWVAYFLNVHLRCVPRLYCNNSQNTVLDLPFLQ